jgi:hypothetical protein
MSDSSASSIASSACTEENGAAIAATRASFLKPFMELLLVIIFE